MRAVDPKPRENLLTSRPTSKMQFMREYLIHDSERDGLVRFRGPLIEPNWAGVEENESEYVVDDSWIALYHVARQQYGDPNLDWVIAMRNRLDLPDTQIYRGMTLKVPNRDWVEDTLLPQGVVLRSIA